MHVHDNDRSTNSEREKNKIDLCAEGDDGLHTLRYIEMPPRYSIVCEPRWFLQLMVLTVVTIFEGDSE
jgi:hypothetical protein